MTFNRRRLSSDENKLSGLSEFFDSKTFCDEYGESCLAAGNTAVGLIGFSFALSVVVTVLMLLRLFGKDTYYVWVCSTISYLLIWIFVAIAVGNFTAKCTDPYAVGLSNALVLFRLELVKVNGVVFNVLIAAIVFSVINMGVDGYFKHEETERGATGIAPAAPPKASMGPKEVATI